MMKLIFLDFDGVLINRDSFRLPRTPCDYEKATFNTAHPDCVAALNRITEETGACIVISSVWRMHGVTRLRRYLKTIGVKGKVIGKTPDLARATSGVIIQAVERGHEIQAWLDKCQEPIAAFVILDDDKDMAHLSDRLVLTKFMPGLTMKDAQRAIAILNQ